MKTKFFNYIIFSLLMFTYSNNFASSKTLPERVWKIDAYYSNHDIVKGKVNPTDIGTFESRDASSLTMNDFELFRNFNAIMANTLNLDTPVIHDWNRQRSHLDIAYGITNAITFFLHLTHEKAVADFTDAYVEQTNIIENALQTGLPQQAALYNSAPDKATSNHLRDTFIGFKFSLEENLSLTYRFSAGPLKTGIDSTEKKQADGVLELETGMGYDIYQFILDYDINTYKLPIQLSLGYFVLGSSTQSFLDNSNIHIDHGNMLYLKMGTQYKFHKKLMLNVQLDHLFVEKDEAQRVDATSIFRTQTDVPNTKTSVEGSSGYALIGKAGIHYLPREFWHVFLKVEKPFSNTVTGQVYDFPGRLEPGLKVIFGTTLLYKF